MRKATIDDVAKLAGVSIKTVSRVVNREPNVRDSTRESVEHAIAELNYRPNQSARNLASHRSRLIVLIYDDPSVYEIASSGYVTRLQHGALRACHHANYELLIHPCRIRSRSVVGELQGLIEHIRPAGIVLAAPLSNMKRIVRAIESTGAPFVQLSPGKVNGGQFSVATNDQEVSAEMTRYLASLGHTRIAFIKGNPRHKAVGNRFQGYKDGLAASGLPYLSELVRAGDNSIGSGEENADALLRLAKPPTAIFAANDDMAVGVVRVAAKRGVDIPGQLSVAGCDDNSLAQQIYPALTTIRQPLAAMAETAAASLIEDLQQASHHTGTEVVEASIRIRESTGPAPS